MLESIALGPYSGLCSLQCVVMNMNRFCVIGLPRRITHHQSIDAWTSNGGIRIAMPCQITHDMGVHFGQKRGRMAVACQAYPNGPWVRRYTQRWHAHKRLMENRCVESYLVYLRKTNEWATMACGMFGLQPLWTLRSLTWILRSPRETLRLPRAMYNACAKPITSDRGA